MSNFSHIGFPIQTQDEFQTLISQAMEVSAPVPAGDAFYFLYTDPSGAMLWMQMDENKQFCGVNPHFKGESRRKVQLVESIDRSESPLDGALKAWAMDTNEEALTEAYPFVFDLPDFKTNEIDSFPKEVEIQLAAFPREFRAFDSEDEFYQSQGEGATLSAQAFIPTGLFSPDGQPIHPPQAYGIFTGIIKDARLRTNRMTGAPFFWMMVESLGGEVDVIAEAGIFKQLPQIGGVVQGQFWLSGRIL